MTSLPKQMRAAAMDRYGGPEVLTLHSLPVPNLDNNEVLIAIHAAGVGSWDAEMRGGWYPGTPPPFPLILGTDGAGTVVAESGTKFKLGETVYSYSFANPKGGFYAEYVAVSVEKVGRSPSRLSLEEAGAVATVGLTAIQGIDDRLHVKRGESIIIFGGSGGVGSIAIQLNKGASV